MKVYISGVITGLTEEQFKASFAQAEKILESEGFSDYVNPCKVEPCETEDCRVPVVSSQTHFSDGSYIHDWKCYMRHDIKAMMDCRAIAMIPGWRKSKGATLEMDLAQRLGFTILFFDHDMTRLLKDDE